MPLPQTHQELEIRLADAILLDIKTMYELQRQMERAQSTVTSPQALEALKHCRTAAKNSWLSMREDWEALRDRYDLSCSISIDKPDERLRGANGRDGNTILNGNGDPTPSLGKVGDFFINLSTYEMRGPKTETGWPSETVKIRL